MDFAIKAEMNAEILAGELIQVARDISGFDVAPDLDHTGRLRSGSFSLTPQDDLGIEGLVGKTFVEPALPFELQISVAAICWPEDTSAAKEKALRSIFEPLVDKYNQVHPSKASIVPRS